MQRRVLAAYTGSEREGLNEAGRLGPFQELQDLAGSEAEVSVLRQRPSLALLQGKAQAVRPAVLYLTSSPPGETSAAPLQPLSLSTDEEAGMGAQMETATFQELLQGVGPVQLVYIDGLCTAEQADALRAAGAQHVVHWEPERAALTLHAAQFGHTFLAVLQNPGAAITEAFAIASHICHMHCAISRGGLEPPAPLLPRLASVQPAALPASSSVLLPRIEGKDFSQGISAVVPGWDDVRLLAPHAELRLLACGQSSLVCAQRLSYLGEALRALLVLEVRGLTVQRQVATERIPAHLPPGCTAVRCDVQSASGAQAVVVLGGPPDVLHSDQLVEHALRQTLVADALSLQFKLPPPGVPPPAARSSQAVAGGTPVVDALAVTSVWAVNTLRLLCQISTFRGLVALGVGAVGSVAVAAWGITDAERFIALLGRADGFTNGVAANGISHIKSSAPAIPAGPAMISGQEAPHKPLPPHQSHQWAGARAGAAGVPRQLPEVDSDAELHTAALQQGQSGRKRRADGHGTGSQPKRARSPDLAGSVDGAGAPAAQWHSNRPALGACSNAELLEDLRMFLQDRRSRVYKADVFPEAVLNGSQLDLATLYREIFPRMSNFTANHRMTGVGNALKRHYQQWLLDYQNSHPEDVGDAADMG